MSRETTAQVGWILLTLAIAVAIVWGGFATGSARRYSGCCNNACVEAAADARVPRNSSVSGSTA